eukprot:Amastigsp_a183631_20.p2 type:complete len:112 gc:universal Amastigsp_a183631_20:890-555(-)
MRLLGECTSLELTTPESTSRVTSPPLTPNRMSVSRRSPTMQMRSRARPSCATTTSSMICDGLPTIVGVRCEQVEIEATTWPAPGSVLRSDGNVASAFAATKRVSGRLSKYC